MNGCWCTKVLVSLSLVISFFAHAIRTDFFDEQCTYTFNLDHVCSAIDSAESLQELVPLLAEQVKLHIYCAERSCGRIFEVKEKDVSTMRQADRDGCLEEVKDCDDKHNSEYFFQDWDEPFVAAGMKDELSIRLEEWIHTLEADKVPSCLRINLDELSLRATFFQRFNQLWSERNALLEKALEVYLGKEKYAESVREQTLWSVRNSVPEMVLASYVDADKYDALTKKLDELVYENFRDTCFRKKMIKDFLRVWLMKRGKLPRTPPLKKCLKKEVLDHLKEEFLENAHALRWEHERQTHGIGVFARYLTCCNESSTLTHEQLEAFCHSLARIIHVHLDVYGVPSTFPEDYTIEDSFVFIKDLIKDNVRRFHALLGRSFVKVTERIDGEKGLQGLRDGTLYPVGDNSTCIQEGTVVLEADDDSFSSWPLVKPRYSYATDCSEPFVVLQEQTDCPVPCRIFPYLVAPSQTLLARRELFAAGIQANLEEEARLTTPRGRGPVSPFSSRSATASPHLIGRPLTFAEKVWKKFELIHRLCLDPENSHKESLLSLQARETSGAECSANLDFANVDSANVNSANVNSANANSANANSTKANSANANSLMPVSSEVSLMQPVSVAQALATFSSRLLSPPLSYDEVTLPHYDN